MKKDEAKAPEKDDWSVVQGHGTVEQALRERWDDPKAGEKDPIVVIHYRNHTSQVMAAWLTATFVAAWERCARVFAKKTSSAASPRLRVLLWGGGDDELPLGRTSREWEEKSVLSVGRWKEWMGHADLASIIRILYDEEQLSGDFGQALQFVFGWCDHAYRDQQAHNLRVAYDAVVMEGAEFVGPDGKTVKAVLIPTTARALASVALERGVALLVIREADGRMTANWNKRFGEADISGVVRAIGIEERRAKEQGREFLSFDDVVKIATKVLNPRSWEPGFAPLCNEGYCGSGVQGNDFCDRDPWDAQKCLACKLKAKQEPRGVRCVRPRVPAPVAKPAPAANGQKQAEAPAPPPVMDMAPSP